MPPDTPVNGRLIALEGNGPDLSVSAKQLLRSLGGKAAGGISQWDASGIFYELQRGDPNLAAPSARLLILLYASDLVFRLRWEIRPALEEGKWVIAAPYIETAIAFGKAAGLPRRWLAELFRFAPKAQACYRMQEPADQAAWMGKPSAGFLEFCSAKLTDSSPLWHADELREKHAAYLHSLEKRGRCQLLTPQVLAAAGSV